MPRRSTVVFLALALGAACGRTNEHPPDELLRDSLGLAESDQVFRIELSGEGGLEAARPTEIRVPVGAYVEFVTTDRRLHTVAFPLDELPSDAADFLRGTGQDASPPLIELGSRFVLSFEEAPPGRYTYVVEGNGESARGAVVVRSAGEDG